MTKTKLSRTTLNVFAFLLVAGLGFGAYRYSHRPATFPPNDPANNAILVHLIIAACVVLTVAAIQLYRKRKRLSNIWLAPFSQNALQRFKATILPKPVTVLSIIRAALCLPLLIVILFEPFRMGAQIIGALDPSEPANAWGGPSYAGAMAAHYMDCLIFIYVSALILHWIMARHVPANKTNALK